MVRLGNSAEEEFCCSTVEVDVMKFEGQTNTQSIALYWKVVFAVPRPPPPLLGEGEGKICPTRTHTHSTRPAACLVPSQGKANFLKKKKEEEEEEEKKKRTPQDWGQEHLRKIDCCVIVCTKLYTTLRGRAGIKTASVFGCLGGMPSLQSFPSFLQQPTPEVVAGMMENFAVKAYLSSSLVLFFSIIFFCFFHLLCCCSSFRSHPRAHLFFLLACPHFTSPLPLPSCFQLIDWSIDDDRILFTLGRKNESEQTRAKGDKITRQTWHGSGIDWLMIDDDRDFIYLGTKMILNKNEQEVTK